MKTCQQWLVEAKRDKANYGGLTSGHNHAIAAKFSQGNVYAQDLQAVVTELTHALASNDPGNAIEIKTIQTVIRYDKIIKYCQQIVASEVEAVDIKAMAQKMDHIDAAVEDNQQMLKQNHPKNIDINDEAVTNRWSRYIGAMGIEAVKKQATAQVLLIGFGALGLEIAKNIVLSGVKRLSILDTEIVTADNLVGNFYLSVADIGKRRIDSAMKKLQLLNSYVIVDEFQVRPNDVQSIRALIQGGNRNEFVKVMKNYNVIVATELSPDLSIELNLIAGEVKAKYIDCDCKGLFGKIFVDFGKEHEVADVDGAEYPEVFIQSIDQDDKGLVKVLEGTTHNLGDGDVVQFSKVNEANVGGKTLNSQKFEVKVHRKDSFYIGDTRGYCKYVNGGLFKKIKQKLMVNHVDLLQMLTSEQGMKLDDNLTGFDPENQFEQFLTFVCFQTCYTFQDAHNRTPKPWNLEDTNEFERMVNEAMKARVVPKLVDLTKPE